MLLRLIPPNLYRPAAFHGAGIRRGPYFEGWYFKIVDAAGGSRYAIIPGLFIGEDPAESHAFVQTLDGVSGQTTYHRYPAEAFVAHPREFLIRVGENEFSSQHMALRIEDERRRMHGLLRFRNVQEWPVTLRSPGVMGWYAYVPFMECYHGVVGLDHSIEGMLAIDGRAVDFTRGRGYIEKDWGEAFPRAWIWMQTNHFAGTGTCLTASVARIPWLGGAFRGFIVGLLHEGILYRFATYTGARLERLEVSSRTVELALQGPVWVNHGRRWLRLEIAAQRSDEHVDLLHAPYRTAMLQRVLESLTATVAVRLRDCATHVTLFEGVGAHAGLELGGNLEEIL